MALSYILVVVSARTQPVMYLRSNAAPGMTKIQSGSSIAAAILSLFSHEERDMDEDDLRI